MENVPTYKSVVLTTDHPDQTAHFYREVLGLPIEPERHRGADRHWAGPVGDLHFAIHPRQGFWLPTPAHGAADTIVSFTAAVEPFEARFAAHGIEVIGRSKIGPMSFIAVRDPDGRNICIGTAWPERKQRAAP
jgi:catechol 2,3-dioxygenase-like lactoylglutathione lyase family enzyme